jgi:hypothetical protein
MSACRRKGVRGLLWPAGGGGRRGCGLLGRSLATAGIGRQTIEQGEELGVVEQEEGRCGRAISRAWEWRSKG